MAENETKGHTQGYIETMATEIYERTWKAKQFLLKFIKKDGVEFARREISDQNVLNLFGSLRLNGVLVDDVAFEDTNNGFELKIPAVKIGAGSLAGANCEENEILVSCSSNQITLLNFSGRILWKLSMDFAPQAFSFTPDGYLMMSHFKRCEISFARRSDIVVKSYISSAPLCPLGIYCENDGTILVCLVDCFSFTLTKNSRRLVRRYSAQGTILNDIEFAEDKSRLFCCPYRVVGLPTACNKVHVLDVISKNQAKITAIKGTKDIVYQYKGESAGFSPTDLCADMYSNVYVVNAHSNSILVLNPQGAVAARLLDFGSRTISSIASIRGHFVGIGFDDGKLEVYEWKSCKFTTDGKEGKPIATFEIEN
jgi:hypothetical protein